jgi:hypothetical protein
MNVNETLATAINKSIPKNLFISLHFHNHKSWDSGGNAGILGV